MNNDLLSKDHADLDQRMGVLLRTADGGNGPDLAEAWGDFEHALLRHFTLEEQHLFHGYALEQPEEVAALRQAHDALRRDLLALGIRADLHCLRAEAVKRFIADLRAHAAHEEEALYRWAHAHVEGNTWSTIARGLREAREKVMKKVAENLDRLGSRTL